MTIRDLDQAISDAMAAGGVASVGLGIAADNIGSALRALGERVPDLSVCPGADWRRAQSYIAGALPHLDIARRNALAGLDGPHVSVYVESAVVGLRRAIEALRARPVVGAGAAPMPAAIRPTGGISATQCNAQSGATQEPVTEGGAFDAFRSYL